MRGSKGKKRVGKRGKGHGVIHQTGLGDITGRTEASNAAKRIKTKHWKETGRTVKMAILPDHKKDWGKTEEREGWGKSKNCVSLTVRSLYVKIYRRKKSRKRKRKSEKRSCPFRAGGEQGAIKTHIT